MTWVEQAACKEVGPGPWDSDDETNNTYREARRVCRMCPVAAECLEWALTNDERYGMWGGMTPVERRDLGLPERRTWFDARRQARRALGVRA
jgi:WhiB family redox-sensing transcriptional regulator